MLPLKGMSIDRIALVEQDSFLYVAVSLILDPSFSLTDNCDMAKQLKPQIHVLLVECDKGLDDVGLFEIRVLLSVVGETWLGLAYVQMFPLLRS